MAGYGDDNDRCDFPGCGVDVTFGGYTTCGRCSAVLCRDHWPQHKSACYEDEYAVHPAQIMRRIPKEEK